MGRPMAWNRYFLSQRIDLGNSAVGPESDGCRGEPWICCQMSCAPFG
jgi:hypothetical protein